VRFIDLCPGANVESIVVEEVHMALSLTVNHRDRAIAAEADE